MNAPFVPEPGFEFAQDEVLAHWHLTNRQQAFAESCWRVHVEDPFR